MRIKRARVALIALCAVALTAAGAVSYLRRAPRHVPDGQPPLSSLSAAGLGELRAAFNARSDRVRVLVLLSPT